MEPGIEWGNVYLRLITFFKEEAVGIVVSISLILFIGRVISAATVKYIQDQKKVHSIRKWTRYITSIFAIGWTLLLYNSHMQQDTPFTLFLIGIFLAGVAISMRDIFSNVVGWIIIISGKGYKSGDRIRIGDVSGDVIEIGVLRTIVAEIGNWVEADQSTGRLISIPNSMVLNNEVYNYTQGFDLIWNETKTMITFESNWQAAEKILQDIAEVDFLQKKEELKNGLKDVKKKFMLQYNYISPKVYVDIKDSGVELTLRYMVKARRRRTLEDMISREILLRFSKEDNIDFAYPTMRLYKAGMAN